jgi:hypothetical protein
VVDKCLNIADDHFCFARHPAGALLPSLLETVTPSSSPCKSGGNMENARVDPGGGPSHPPRPAQNVTQLNRNCRACFQECEPPKFDDSAESDEFVESDEVVENNKSDATEFVVHLGLLLGTGDRQVFWSNPDFSCDGVSHLRRSSSFRSSQ